MARVRFGDVPADEERSEYERWAPGTYQKMVPLDNLHEHPDNWDLVGRIDETRKNSLREDIGHSGIREALQVWLHDGRLVVVSGHERLAIARELGLSELPCVKVDFDSEDAARRHIFATNYNRKTVHMPKPELLKKLFPPETSELLYADLRANYDYGAANELTAGKLTLAPEGDGGAVELTGGNLSSNKRELSAAARKRRERQREDQRRMRREASELLKTTDKNLIKVINQVNQERRASKKKTEKPRELTPEERKKRDALDKKLTVLRDRIEKKDVQFERLREDLRELRGEERRIVRMLEKFGQPELFE